MDLSVRFLAPDSDRDELVEALSLVNRQAMVERRRGYAGVAGARYASLHEFMNVLLDWLVPGEGSVEQPR